MFTDRTEAGRQLAARLTHVRAEQPVVLALPRGGVPVAFVVADVLAAPLDLVLVRKIGAPGHAELAVGAVVDGQRPEIVVNEDILSALGVPRSYVDEQAREKLKEIEERRRRYLRDRRRVDVTDRVAIVVDDGIATGATTRAALEAIKRARPKRLIVAVPVAPPETVEALRGEVDEVVCLMTPEPFGAIGRFYEQFPQLTDAEVIDLLDRAGARQPGAAASE